MSTVIPPRETKEKRNGKTRPDRQASESRDNQPSHLASDETAGAEGSVKRKVFSLMGILAVTAAIGVGWWALAPRERVVSGQVVMHTAKRIDLNIKVTERGNLESQVNEVVRCEVDDVREDGVHGTPIVWIVENGASVKKGDVIVELDSSPLQERFDAQVLEVEEENAEFIQAKVQFDNQKTQNATALAEAELQVKLAKLALQQFGDEEAGTFQIDLQDIELQIQEAKAGQLIEQTNLQGVERLYKLGYRSSNEVAEARLNALRSERALATAMSKKRELVEYEYKKQKMALEGALRSAERAYDQVVLDNKANLAQAEARLASSREQLNKEKERLERYRSQLKLCTIHAPQDGMVAYYVGSGRRRREEIRAGVAVRPRQAILTLPNLQKMQVKTAIHESVLDKISKGMHATVQVDAFPDMTFPATVASVAVLPDQGGWMSSDTKVYETIVTIDQDVTHLKPGMTAVVDIHVAHLDDVLAIPVQAVVQVGESTWCYVENDGQYERRSIELGMSNSNYVEVADGIQEGDQIVLNPTVFQLEDTDDDSESGERTEDTTSSDGSDGVSSGSDESERGPSGGTPADSTPADSIPADPVQPGADVAGGLAAAEDVAA